MKYRIFAAFGAVAVVCALAWLSGFDFDSRGSEAFMVAYCSISAAVLAWIFTPLINEAGL